MKKILLISITLLFFTAAFTQNVDIIIKKNIFDPKRGVEKQQHDNKDYEEVEKENLPKELPWLDGIITVGKYKKAIFRYKDEKSRKFVPGTFKEGDVVGGAKIKKITAKEVLVIFEGKAYKLNVDSKYNMDNYHKKHYVNSARRVPTSTNPGTTRSVRGRSVTPVKSVKGKTHSVPSRTTGKGISTPFGTAKATTSNKSKRKKHPF